MPKFYRQNKKKINPRYFLDETIEEQGPQKGNCEVTEFNRGTGGKAYKARWKSGNKTGPAAISASKDSACADAREAFYDNSLASRFKKLLGVK